MDSLQANYKEEDEEEGKPNTHLSPRPAAVAMDTTTAAPIELSERKDGAESSQNDVEQPQKNAEPPQINNSSTASASESLSESDPTTSNDTEKPNEDENENEEEDEDDPPPKKQKQLSSLEDPTKTTTPAMPPIQNDATDANNDVKTPTPTTATATATKKKAKKKNNNNVWVTKSTRKGKKKAKPNPQNTPTEDTVLITPVPRFPDKNDDSPDMKVCLSKVYKAEKVELSEDRMSAGSTKGYRMVRATRGVCEGAWYFEVKVVILGESGHTRLGWSTEKGDLQAPVGYDGNSFGYRDVDGSKVHKALREKYGEEGYKEGDVIGFYINLPGGEHYSPNKPQFVWHKGQRYACAADAKEDPLKVVPGSEISFFRNGVCQGVAFKDINGGRYYPAASMYTLPNQPNCLVKFNFGPDFEFYPEDFGGRPVPRPMVEVPYHGFDSRVETGVSNEKKH